MIVTFGFYVRREREAREIGLRQMAKMLGVSAGYLSKVERGEFAPPTEEKVRAIATVIGCDHDELLALAGRTPADLSDIIKRRPVEMAALLRAADALTAGEITNLIEMAAKLRRETA